MELLYVWIEDFKNIRKQGFNLSPKHWFDFEPRLDDKGKIEGGKLTHSTRNPKYPKNFFGENISNVTAIVGKNGSGKSNLLEYICYDAYHGAASFKVYLENNDLIVSINIGKQLDIEKSTYNGGYQFIEDQDNFFYTVDPKYIFYSGALELRSQPNSAVVDISKFRQLRKSSENAYQHIQRDNTESQAKFLLEHSESFRSYFSEFFYVPNKLVFDLDYSFNRFESEIFKKVYARFKEEIGQPRSRHRAALASMCVVITRYVSVWGDKKLDDIEKALSGSNNDIYRFVEQIVDNVSKGKELVKAIKTIQELFDKEPFYGDLLLEDYLPDEKKKEMESSQKEFESPKGFTCRLNDNGKGDFFGLQEILGKLVGINLQFHFMTYSWEGLSYGEDQILLLISRIYNESLALQEEGSILLMIDEGEVGLHPNWQRQFLSILLGFIKELFKTKDIQLVITSHSPFLISDLPKSNVLFLVKDEDTGYSKPEPPSDLAQTFGANIHSLYRSSFFMENGFIGEFAKKKIDWVIGLLNSQNKSALDKHRDEVNFIIENIGEPLLRNKLREMYNGHQTVEQRIQNLEAEIKRLKSQNGES